MHFGYNNTPGSFESLHPPQPGTIVDKGQVKDYLKSLDVDEDGKQEAVAQEARNILSTHSHVLTNNAKYHLLKLSGGLWKQLTACAAQEKPQTAASADPEALTTV